MHCQLKDALWIMCSLCSQCIGVISFQLYMIFIPVCWFHLNHLWFLIQLIDITWICVWFLISVKLCVDPALHVGPIWRIYIYTFCEIICHARYLFHPIDLFEFIDKLELCMFLISFESCIDPAFHAKPIWIMISKIYTCYEIVCHAWFLFHLIDITWIHWYYESCVISAL